MQYRKLFVMMGTAVLSMSMIIGTGGMELTQPVPTKTEAVKLLQNMDYKTLKDVQYIQGNYAINSNTQQAAIGKLDAINFGWSQVNYDATNKKVVLNTTKVSNSDFYIPAGYEQPFDEAQNEDVEKYIMVFMNEKVIDKTADGKNLTLANYIFSNKQIQAQLIQDIVALCNQIPNDSNLRSFDGVTIDFESFYDAKLKPGYNSFLKALNTELKKFNKKLNVAVPPTAYFKGYDYRAIGAIADQVTLMAHDYEAKKLTAEEMKSGFAITPLTPIDAIYDTLAAITDPKTGVQDKQKILLQISFGSAQWQLKNNKIINQRPYTPSYDKISVRLQQKGTTLAYDTKYQNPYAVYYEGDTKNVIWYEDEKSISAKINLASIFGINKISLWRLGTIPNFNDSPDRVIDLDIFNQVLKNDKIK
ncbi:MAG: glycosyl hydrolase family 18 protein [Cellulosilyticaceae bacterium]